MASLGISSPKTKIILKRNPKKKNILTIREDDKILQNFHEKTPVKVSFRMSDEDNTVNKTAASVNSFDSQNLSSSLEFYQSSNPYVLGQINSISFCNGRFYDLLKFKKDCFQVKKQIKCNCLRSKCQAKYCDCFAKGVGCSPLCGCISCKNKTTPIRQQTEIVDSFCRCSKSGCIKKYCQCFQRGDACSSKCRCSNCQNISGE